MSDYLNNVEPVILLDASRDVRDELIPADLASLDQLQEDITRNWRDALPDFSSRQEDQAIGAFMLLPTLEAGVRELTGQGLSGDDAIKKMADAVRVAVCHLIRL